MQIKVSVLFLILSASPIFCSSFSFIPGSIQGQDGWSGGTIPIAASVDQGITGAAFRTGNQSFQISNRAYNGNFNGWVFSPGLAVSAGQAGSNTGADAMSISFWFRSSSLVGDGSNMEFDFGSTAGDDRNTFLAVRNNTDAFGGLQIRLAEPTSPGPDAGFFPNNTVLTGLARGDWHNISMTFYGVDNGSDFFTVSVNGGAPIISPNTSNPNWLSFENFRAASSNYVTVNSLFMRSGAAASALDPSFVDADVFGLLRR